MLTVAIAGILPDDAVLFGKLTEYLGQIKAFLSPEGGAADIDFALSPPYTGDNWKKWLEQSPEGVTVFENAPSGVWDGEGRETVSVDDPLRDTLGELLCDNADLLLAVWNEDVSEHDGATWELLRIALRKRAPCIWISTRSKEAYWPYRTGFEPYRPEKLKELCELTANAGCEAAVYPKSSFPLLFIGRHFYKRYLRKYKASEKTVDADKDLLMRDDYELNGRFAYAEPARRKLLEIFKSYDSASIEQNERYHAALYWRSVLPLITTLIVAVGFFGRSLLAAIPIFSMQTWGIVAGFGFLFHGLLNLYVFLLSKSKRVKTYRENMIDNRKMAETIRVLIHFVPFGIDPDLRRLCGGDLKLYASVRRIIRESCPKIDKVSKDNSLEAFGHICEMMSDQIDYHTRARDRFSRLSEHLERWSHIVFYVGFGVVLMRSLLQFLISFPSFPLPAFTLGNGVRSQDFILGLANMSALLVVAWLSYYTTKLSLCNFRFNRDNHNDMAAMLEEERRNVELLRSSVEEVPVVALKAIGDNLADIMLVKDMALWTQQYKNTQIDSL